MTLGLAHDTGLRRDVEVHLVAGADNDAVGRAIRDSGAVLHEMSTQGALEALYVGLTDED